MSNTDKSSGGMIQRKKAQTLAVFRALNPDVKTMINSESLRSLENIGLCQTSCCTPPGQFTQRPSDFYSGQIFDLDIANWEQPGPFDLSGVSYNQIYDVSWLPVPNATSYEVTIQSDNSDPVSYIWLTETSIRVYAVGYSNTTITAVNDCGSTVSGSLGPCFLEGSLVTLANGSTKPIEDVRVGDIVVGAFGEENVVLGLHRPILGSKQMCKINDEHSTTAHHPHISIDKKFYCCDPYTLDEETYGKTHKVFNAFGEFVDRYLPGLKKGRTQQLVEGVELKTIEGSRVVKTLDMYSLPPETQLYNLVVGGSHTYHVDGYAVTGWPSEEDFDYDSWNPRN